MCIAFIFANKQIVFSSDYVRYKQLYKFDYTENNYCVCA